jgi:hypothetical protein
MKRKWFIGPQGALVVYLLDLEAESERSLYRQGVTIARDDLLRFGGRDGIRTHDLLIANTDDKKDSE